MWSINSNTWKAVSLDGTGVTIAGTHPRRVLPRAERWKLNIAPVTWRNVAQHHAGMSAANQRGRASTLARRKREKEASRQTWIDRLMADTFADIREIEGGVRGPCN